MQGDTDVISALGQTRFSCSTVPLAHFVQQSSEHTKVMCSITRLKSYKNVLDVILGESTN